ncbi:MAG: carboxypeptidase regulatory-like domain-containing protein [Deltaproteobacteria bacterium]|nr:carboxypeptidase regulatory-like domain-containing protein [Deltaproteobacteria bacterium]
MAAPARLPLMLSLVGLAAASPPLAAALAAALATALAPSAHALPLGVRARTEVTLEHRREGRNVVLLGRLVDDRGAPIVDEPIHLELAGLDPETRLTDADGRFEVTLGPESLGRLVSQHGQRLPWSVRFDGSSRLGSAVTTGALDLSKTPTRVVVTVSEPEVTRDDRNIAITVSLTTAERAPAPLSDAEVSLRVGSGQALIGRTGTSGRATFVLRPTLLEGAGSYTIVARYQGDPQRAGSEGRAELRVLLPTRLTLRIAREGDGAQARYRFSGRLADENGAIAEAPIVIVGHPAPRPPPRRGAPERPAPSQPAFELVTATDGDGIFVAALPADALHALAEQVVVVRARFTPTPSDTRHRGVESRPVHLEVPPPPGVPLGWYALGLGVVAAFLALAHAIRNDLFGRAWAQLVLALRAFRLRFRRPLDEVAAARVDPPFVTPVDDADPSRARARDVFSGIVVDAHKRVPLAGATIVVRGSGSEPDGPEVGPEGSPADVAARARTLAGPDGRFALGPVPPGAWVLRVEAPGYLPREIALEVPHAGDYDGAWYALVAVRRRVRDLFTEATAELGAPVAWGFDTPREAAGKALARSPSPIVVGLPLGELTTLVERAHFAPEAVGEAEVERARALREEIS